MIKCKTICRNYLCTKKKLFKSLLFAFLNQTFSLFPIVKMNANLAEICRVGNLEADFQQVLLIDFFLKFSQYCCKISIIQIQKRKVKKYFLRQKFQTLTLLDIEIA